MERNQQNLPPPPDGGWGWIVAIGAFLVQMQVASISITFGVYFAHIRATQNVPAWLVASIPSVMGFIMFFLCPFSTALAKHYETRLVALVGAIIATLSVATSAINGDFYWFFTFFSIFGGIGSGLIVVQGNVTVQKYFLKRRGIANGIFMAGGALGNMLMPIILRFSIHTFGFKITLLLHAACISLTILSALSFKPIKSSEEGLKSTSDLLDKTKEERVAHSIQIDEQEKEDGCYCGSCWLPKVDLRVMKNPLFLVLTFSVVTSWTSLRGMGTLLPAFGESIGLGEELSVYLVSIMSIADFCSRLLVPLLIDFFWPNVKKKYFFIISASLMTLALFIIGMFANTYFIAVICCVLFGVGMGGVAALMSIIYVESLGIEAVHDTIGLMYLCTGIWMLPTLPAVGLLRDLSGSFQSSFLGLAVTNGAGTLVWALEPWVKRKVNEHY